MTASGTDLGTGSAAGGQDAVGTPRETSFGSLRIGFDERVLEPRPWTTSQSRWAADLLRHAPDGPVLELCSGVGHIGLLAVTFQPRDLVMVDGDETACDYARANVAANPPACTVEVRQGRIDEAVAPHERFAGIIADPPWVPSADVGRFPEDPSTAIDGGADGMAVAWSCIDVVARHLDDGGWALLQLGTERQAALTRRRLEETPSLDLEVVEVRSYGDRGVVVHLARPSADW
jgi:methylase of polypeptide subunit release factors